MRLTSRSEYALLAVIDLSLSFHDGPVSSRAIAERRDVPLRFLEQILHALRRAGVVTSVRGARGGFVLAKNPKEMTVLEVVEAVEGPLQSTVCNSDLTQGSASGCEKQASCAASHVWNRATDALRKEFQSTYISDLGTVQKNFDNLVTKESK